MFFIQDVKLLLMLCHQITKYLEESAISPLRHTQSHRSPQLVTVAVIDNRKSSAVTPTQFRSLGLPETGQTLLYWPTLEPEGK